MSRSVKPGLAASEPRSPQTGQGTPCHGNLPVPSYPLSGTRASMSRRCRRRTRARTSCRCAWSQKRPVGEAAGCRGHKASHFTRLSARVYNKGEGISSGLGGYRLHAELPRLGVGRTARCHQRDRRRGLLCGEPQAAPAFGPCPNYAAHTSMCLRARTALRAPRHLPDYRSREQLSNRLLLALDHIHDGFHKD